MLRLVLTLATLVATGSANNFAAGAGNRSSDRVDLLAQSSLGSPADETIGRRAREAAAPLLDQLKSARNMEAARNLEARIRVTWATSGDPQIDALSEQAMLYLQVHDSDSALALLDVVVAKAPGFAEGWNRRAAVLYFQKHFDQSLFDFAHVLVLEPRHFGALAGIALIRAKEGDKRGAAETYQMVLTVDPQNITAQDSLNLLQKDLVGGPA
jgi:tetratricopeptide (TPR) repeat protein